MSDAPSSDVTLAAPACRVLRPGPPVRSAPRVRVSTCPCARPRERAGARPFPRRRRGAGAGGQSWATRPQLASEGLPRATPATHEAANRPGDGSEPNRGGARTRTRGSDNPGFLKPFPKCFHQPRPNLRAGGVAPTVGGIYVSRKPRGLGSCVDTRGLLPEAGSGQGPRVGGPRTSFPLRSPEGLPRTRQRPRTLRAGASSPIVTVTRKPKRRWHVAPEGKSRPPFGPEAPVAFGCLTWGP